MFLTIKDFLDFGFTITYEQTDTMGNWVNVCKDEEEYAKTFEFCKVARTYQEINEFINSLGDRYNLKGRAYSNGELIYIVLRHERKDMKIYCIEKDGVKLRLTAQCDNGEVYSIDDLFGYFNSICSNKCIYNRETTDEDISIEYILSIVYNSRVNNSKEIRNHYNNAIRKLKKEYKDRLDGSKVGMDFLSKYKGE